MNFWNSLGPDERRAFVSVAHERTFPGGARLMREAERANHVMVILSGWAQITVRKNGRQRVIAERGPGQLVGERGALRVNARSATVIALETVHALVMKTEDFARVISAHPGVLDVIESQIYGRLIEEPARHGRWPETLRLGRAANPSAKRAPHHPRILTGENCTVLLTDVVGFGSRGRTDEGRGIIRREILAMTQASLGALWKACSWEDRGDGLLIVVPPDVPTIKVMERLHQELPTRLKRHNRIYSDALRIQLRVAVNVGPVRSDSMGMSGEAIILTARLLDAPVLKAAIHSAAANLGVIVSEFVYDTAIRHAEGGIDSAGYELVQVHVKETRIPAWMQLVDAIPPASRVHGPEAGEISDVSRTGQPSPPPPDGTWLEPHPHPDQ